MERHVDGKFNPVTQHSDFEDIFRYGKPVNRVRESGESVWLAESRCWVTGSRLPVGWVFIQ